MASNVYGGGVNYNLNPQSNDEINDPSIQLTNDSRYEFRVLIEAENGQSESYCGYQSSSAVIGSSENYDANPPIFIDTETDNPIVEFGGGSRTGSGEFVWKALGGGIGASAGNSGWPQPQTIFTTGEVVLKVQKMVSCSFHDYPSSSFGLNGVGSNLYIQPAKDLFEDSDFLGLSTGSLITILTDEANRPSDTGSFSFVQLSNNQNPLKRVKFFGNKVCNMLGLPEDKWLYTDAVRIDTNEDHHVFQGSATFNELTALNTFGISNVGNVTSDLPIRIDPQTPERWVRMIDGRGTIPTNTILIGYQGAISSSYDSFYSQLPDGTTPNFKIATTGNVGAGTLDPLFPLHVKKSTQGSHSDTAVQVDGDYNQVGKLTVQGAISASGELNIYRNNTYPQIELSGDNTIHKWRMGASNEHFYIQAANNDGVAYFRSVDNRNVLAIDLKHENSCSLLVRGDIAAGGYLTTGQDQIRIMCETNARGAGIGFSDQVIGAGSWDEADQHGHIRYFHSDSDNDLGKGSIFQISSDQSLAVQVSGSGEALLYCKGDIAATSDIISNYSDERLKSLEGSIPNALDKILTLNGYYFRENEVAKKLGYDNPNRQVGLSAQEVEKILPEVVKDAPIDKKYKTLQYEKLIPLLIEGIKEQQLQINKLEEQSHEPQNYRYECEQMKKELSKLKRKVNKLSRGK